MSSNVGPFQMLVVLALGLAIPLIAILYVAIRWARRVRSDARQGAGSRGDSVARAEFERLQREVEGLKTTVQNAKNRTL